MNRKKSEYRVNGFIVRPTDDGQIEITQEHLEDQGSGVLLVPEQIDLLIQYLGWAVRDLKESAERE